MATRAVMLSIRPQWVEKIASGEKTVEVRKSRPKLKCSFVCYIYETQGAIDEPWMDENGHMIFRGRGQVVGEFVCDNIGEYGCSYDAHKFLSIMGSCLFITEILKYSDGRTLYGWHISDLVIYDNPKELTEFTFANSVKERWTSDGKRDIKVKKPPQSWCYVQQMEVNV